MEHRAEFQKNPSPRQRSYPTRKFEIDRIAIREPVAWIKLRGACDLRIAA
jgi:hypothetical protein